MIFDFPFEGDQKVLDKREGQIFTIPALSLYC